jgi:hypothetical protein
MAVGIMGPKGKACQAFFSKKLQGKVGNFWGGEKSFHFVIEKVIIPFWNNFSKCGGGR